MERREHHPSEAAPQERGCPVCGDESHTEPREDCWRRVMEEPPKPGTGGK